MPMDAKNTGARKPNDDTKGYSRQQFTDKRRLTKTSNDFPECSGDNQKD
jgi:hypothetical protein